MSEAYEDKIRKRVKKAIDWFAKDKGVGVDEPAHSELAAVIVKELGNTLRGPSSGQVLLLDSVHESFDGGYRRRFTNPRVQEADGRDAEEIMFPVSEHGELLSENGVAQFVMHLPHPDWFPDV